MKRIYYYIFSILCLWAVQEDATAQELRCEVKITTPKLQTVDPKVFGTLESAIREFMNSQKWTDDYFEPEERIECNFQINIQDELSETKFRADIALQSTRPIYGTDVKTAIVLHVDKEIIFDYEEYQPLEDSRDVFRDNLSSLFTFYAYLILGYDYDSFSELGGEEYFRTAQNIINSIPPGVANDDKGWASQSKKTSRYWIIENLLNPRVTPLRKANYDYHRLGLDYMHKDPAAGRDIIFSALQAISEVESSYPNTVAVSMFANAKSDEIVEIFKKAELGQRRSVYDIMRRVDPAHISKYNILRN